MMKTNYREINTIEGLDSAIRKLRRVNRKRGEELKAMIIGIKDIYTPRALVSEGFRRATHTISFWGIALNMVRFTRRLLTKKK